MANDQVDELVNSSELERQVRVLEKQRDKMKTALRECANALRDEVEARRGSEVERRIDRDLTPVHDAEAVLMRLDERDERQPIPWGWRVMRVGKNYALEEHDHKGDGKRGIVYSPDTDDDILCGMLEAIVKNKPSIPEGWKLVPLEPNRLTTAKGVIAADNAHSEYERGHYGPESDAMRQAYRAMVRAAPNVGEKVSFLCEY